MFTLIDYYEFQIIFYYHLSIIGSRCIQYAISVFGENNLDIINRIMNIFAVKLILYCLKNLIITLNLYNFMILT